MNFIIEAPPLGHNVSEIENLQMDFFTEAPPIGHNVSHRESLRMDCYIEERLLGHNVSQRERACVWIVILKNVFLVTMFHREREPVYGLLY